MEVTLSVSGSMRLSRPLRPDGTSTRCKVVEYRKSSKPMPGLPAGRVTAVPAGLFVQPQASGSTSSHLVLADMQAWPGAVFVSWVVNHIVTHVRRWGRSAQGFDLIVIEQHLGVRFGPEAYFSDGRRGQRFFKALLPIDLGLQLEPAELDGERVPDLGWRRDVADI